MGAVALAATLIAGLGVGVATAYADDPTVEPQIIGGGEASEPYEFMASLKFVDKDGVDTEHQCGASLVSRGWAVTAAHCVDDPPANLTAEEKDALAKKYGLKSSIFSHTPSEGTFYIRAGDHDRTQGVRAEVTQIAVHEGFHWWDNSPPDEANDIAMLKLDRTLDVQFIQIIPDDVEPTLPGDEVRLLGWGITEPDGTGTDPLTLQELDTEIVADTQCTLGMQGDITDKEICVGNKYGTDGPCYGDSGGPAIKKGKDGRWKLVGITSRGPRYCGTSAAIYTSPQKHRNWIYTTMRGVELSIPEPRKPEATYTLPYEPGDCRDTTRC